MGLGPFERRLDKMNEVRKLRIKIEILYDSFFVLL